MPRTPRPPLPAEDGLVRSAGRRGRRARRPHHGKDEASLYHKKRAGFVARSSADPFAAASSQTQPWRVRIDMRRQALQAAVTQAFAKETSVDFRVAWLAPPSPLDLASGGLILGDASVDASHRLATWLSLRALGDGVA